MSKTIVDLCSGTGAWSKPYLESGYQIMPVDIKRGNDVRLMKQLESVFDIRGILAAPPCTHLAGSGARWWNEKGDEALIEALSIVDACLRVVMVNKPDWWCLENPVGRLVHYIGKPQMYFHPWEYAGWADNPESEAYTKKTCLWGDFDIPEKNPVDPISQKIWKMPPSEDRSMLRSITPSGFARAFKEANP